MNRVASVFRRVRCRRAGGSQTKVSIQSGGRSEKPVPNRLVAVVFHSLTGNREQNMLLRSKDITRRVGITAESHLKNVPVDVHDADVVFRVRRAHGLQYWLGHKSLETTPRKLVLRESVRSRTAFAGKSAAGHWLTLGTKQKTNLS